MDPNMISNLPMIMIPYEIFDYSSAASTYFPHHVLHDQPQDQGSRWTTTESDQSQFLTVKLQRKAILRQLIFGKFQKPHVCNLKEFRVFAGLSPDSMIEIFHGGLENTPGNETIAVNYQSESGIVLFLVMNVLLSFVPHQLFLIFFNFLFISLFISEFLLNLTL
ncbi:hypothetical protein HMI56_001646 [Coelomomyces lativittatus]|nr:hypothetical protein HMI56_001646 [Coelomomyces lativittatus]